MPIFRYKGYRNDGSEVVGTIEANSPKDAILKLKDIGLYPAKVREAVYRKRCRIFSGSDVSRLPFITRQLSNLLSSGVALIESIKSISEESNEFWRNILIDIKERVAGGSSFSKSLEIYSDIFPEYYVNMVAAGEISGNLDKVLVKLADFLEKQYEIKAKVRISMIYPLFMICIGFIVLSFLFTFVVPKITKIFEDTQNALPLITLILITVSDFFQDYWWLIIAILLIGVYGIKKIRQDKRELVDSLILHLPGNIVQSLYYARFTRILSFLLEGGLPILKALDIAAKSIGNKVLEANVLEASKKVAEGLRLSAALNGFPPVLLQMISTGERSGKLIEVLKNAAFSYEEEFSRRVQKSLSLLEPAMILIMGFIVGFIVLAVLLPIFQLNQLIK